MSQQTSLNECLSARFTKHELEDAASMLASNMSAFYRTDDIGYRIRQNAIRMFKEEQDIACNDAFQIAIIADLHLQPEISYAVFENMSYDKECGS